MTPAAQHTYWLRFHRWQYAQEKAWTPAVNKALRAQINQYIETGTVMAVQITPVAKVLHDLYASVAPGWAQLSTIQIRRTKYRSPIGFNERIIELMQQYYGIDLLNMSNDITQTTIDTIQTVLQRAAASGASFDDIVKQLQSPDLTAKRARVIARTETVAAANSASNIAAIQTGLLMDKIWIDAKDNRERRTHLIVGGSVVGMKDTFTVGGKAMQFPGDKAGGAAECIQCRCTHAFIPKRDKSGRVLRS